MRKNNIKSPSNKTVDEKRFTFSETEPHSYQSTTFNSSSSIDNNLDNERKILAKKSNFFLKNIEFAEKIQLDFINSIYFLSFIFMICELIVIQGTVRKS